MFVPSIGSILLPCYEVSPFFLPYVLFWTLLEYSLISFWTYFCHLFCHHYLSISVCMCDCPTLLEMSTEPDLLISAVLQNMHILITLPCRYWESILIPKEVVLVI